VSLCGCRAATAAIPLSSHTAKVVQYETASDNSLWEAAEEAGVSRIYGGIHFSFDNTAGLSSGDAIGQYVFNNWLTPLP